MDGSELRESEREREREEKGRRKETLGFGILGEFEEGGRVERDTGYDRRWSIGFFFFFSFSKIIVNLRAPGNGVTGGVGSAGV